MGINSTEVAYGFGQLGSAYINTGGDSLIPPVGYGVVCIVPLEDITFATLAAEDSSKYINDVAGAQGLAVGFETTDYGSGGLTLGGTEVFPKGVPIYGRWTEVEVVGSAICYIG